MKTIGLIGGLSWKSTVLYYEQININGNRHLGCGHTPHMLLDSLNFEYLSHTLSNNLHREFGEYLSASIERLKFAGASCIAICCNTAHIVVAEIAKTSPLPIIDIRHATGKFLAEKKIKNALILGTKFTMEEDFYKNEIETFGINCLIPKQEDRATIHKIIFEELCLGLVTERSKETMKKIIHNCNLDASCAIVLACTELPLIIKQEDFIFPVVDTAQVHVEEVLSYSLNNYDKVGSI